MLSLLFGSRPTSDPYEVRMGGRIERETTTAPARSAAPTFAAAVPTFSKPFPAVSPALRTEASDRRRPHSPTPQPAPTARRRPAAHGTLDRAHVAQRVNQAKDRFAETVEACQNKYAAVPVHGLRRSLDDYLRCVNAAHTEQLSAICQVLPEPQASRCATSAARDSEIHLRAWAAAVDTSPRRDPLSGLGASELLERIDAELAKGDLPIRLNADEVRFLHDEAPPVLRHFSESMIDTVTNYRPLWQGWCDLVDAGVERLRDARVRRLDHLYRTRADLSRSQANDVFDLIQTRHDRTAGCDRYASARLRSAAQRTTTLARLGDESAPDADAADHLDPAPHSVCEPARPDLQAD